METKNTWTRVRNDVNGNGRFVTHWCGYGFRSYEQAIKAANKIGGRKFHNRQYGGGIVFQAYESSLPDLESLLTELARGQQ